MEGKNREKNIRKGGSKNVSPVKGNPVGEIVRKIILIISSLVFVGSAAAIVNILVIQPRNNQAIYDELKETYYNVPEDLPEDPYKLRQEQLENIRQINSDIIGWIKIDNTNIDNPVLLPPKDDSDYYLYRNYKKENTRYGSMFVASNTDINDCKNIVVHGHHMRDGSMFANLMKFSDLDFYRQNPVFKFDTINNTGDWKIISIFKTNTRKDQGEVFQYLKIGFADDNEFLNYVYNVRERSLIDIPVDVNENDELVTLSTCSYEFEDFRTVVVARKVRSGESTEVDVSKAEVNPDPLMPQIWYDKRGGIKPEITDFNTAYNNGKIDWYVPLN